ncbi:DinB family protein [Terracidiphilus gabretensis]|uniref:DinB family protein n=1 Tax=Terracidiphilus gabretensis TaxID=1577687 RepID=UPI00071BE505|nr:DinB family protein [Terracidiphilus gabretensis]
MNALRSASSFAFAVILCTAAARPQMPAQSAQPHTHSEALLGVWNYEGNKLIAMAEDFPEDKYDYKPNPAQRSFAEQLLHAAGGNYFLINPAKGKRPPTGDPKRSDFKSKAEIVAYVRKSFADGAALIQAKGEKGLNDVFPDGESGSPVHFGDNAWGWVVHSGEHYGQLVVYYRVLGLVPPESRPKK